MKFMKKYRQKTQTTLRMEIYFFQIIQTLFENLNKMGKII